ncbi:hypothetical protein GDO81_000771 [Engystomops pustulosus]|uniref:Albumin domain-containing protein n=1 Tax=Engystomops pustulosus TaxID=76066 RepID=A0AAV7D731_ENGPU|nr:hypothetical protein GDO81_000771 [Engystomops pustulosus]KAG8593244.1 hypothetical protein GDO81_000771 [Engystomops pustulosus]KAG8593245.1 hypothetical protein GDO81_000771 [Engystomops pustulosus]
MKLVTLICLLLCSITIESRNLQKRDEDHHPRLIGEIHTAIGSDNFNHIILAMLAQDLQHCKVEDHVKVMLELAKFAQGCVDDESNEECKKPMINVYYDKVCAIPKLDEAYPWTKDCCVKAEPERAQCFHEHRDIPVEPYKIPDAEAACKLHKEQHHDALHYYIHTIAKRHPNIYPPAVLALAGQYDTILTECCEEEEKVKCFESKFVEVHKATLYIENKQKHVCHVLKEFPERVFQAIMLARFAIKYPGSSFDVIQKLVHEAVHLNKDCCKHDVVECMIEKLEFNKHVCEHQADISPNLKVCCEKPIMERTPCIIAMPQEPTPESVPKELKEFVEDEHVCQNFAEHKDAFLAKFVFAFGRTHLTLGVTSLLIVAKGYEDLITACCAKENPVECYKTAPQLLEAGIKESLNLLKQNCDALQKIGTYAFTIQ